MREVEKTLTILLKKYPSLRLCQLIANATDREDIFYVKDEALDKQLKKFDSELSD